MTFWTVLIPWNRIYAMLMVQLMLIVVLQLNLCNSEKFNGRIASYKNNLKKGRITHVRNGSMPEQLQPKYLDHDLTN